MEISKKNPEKLTIVKIGGHVIDDESALSNFLSHFSEISGLKMLIHGGGKAATQIANQLNIPQTMIEGRRVTDEKTLQVITKVYGGLINKNLVAELQGRGISALGVTGADGDCIRSTKRSPHPIDYGYVGDVESVQSARFLEWLRSGLTPVIAPLTHDGKGQLLNTNADTIATEVAIAMSEFFQVRLFYCFEKSGVLRNVNEEASLISEIDSERYSQMKEAKAVHSGMIPKLDNAFRAIRAGVEEVILGKADSLPALILGQCGTRLSL